MRKRKHIRIHFKKFKHYITIKFTIVQKFTIVTGKQSSGKSTLARKMIENLKAVIVSDSKYPGLKEAFEHEPEVIVLDEARAIDIQVISNYLKIGSFTYRPQYNSETITKPFPKVICCTNHDINTDLFPEAEFINL